MWVDCCANTNENVTARDTDNDKLTTWQGRHGSSDTHDNAATKTMKTRMQTTSTTVVIVVMKT